ncbi:MAG: hypothetical protein WC523_05990 [Patescibacteria group bacterium]
MEYLFLILSFVSIICLIIGLIKPSAFSRLAKGITRKKVLLIFGSSTIIFFILFNVFFTNTSDNQNQITETPPVAENTVKTQALAQHKVIPQDIHGTFRIVDVIVQSNITKDEIIAINDDLIKTYSTGLDILNIEYFDDEKIASDYFQKISKVSETESDRLFKHYLGTYTMNKTTGYNELGFNENNNWTTIKKY